MQTRNLSLLTLQYHDNVFLQCPMQPAWWSLAAILREILPGAALLQQQLLWRFPHTVSTVGPTTQNPNNMHIRFLTRHMIAVLSSWLDCRWFGLWRQYFLEASVGSSGLCFAMQVSELYAS